MIRRFSLNGTLRGFPGISPRRPERSAIPQCTDQKEAGESSPASRLPLRELAVDHAGQVRIRAVAVEAFVCERAANALEVQDIRAIAALLDAGEQVAQ